MRELEVNADLLWHMRMIPVSSFNTTYDVTTANGYESNGINVGGTTLLQMSLSMMAIKLWSWEYCCIWRETCTFKNQWRSHNQLWIHFDNIWNLQWFLYLC